MKNTMTQQIRAIMIVEVLGRPADHLKAALKDHIEKIRSIKNVELVSTNYSKPKKVEDEQHKDVFTAFAEVEVLCENFFKLAELMFDFMPSSIEVLDPADIKISSQEATSLLSDLSGRLHKYDEIAKMSKMQVQQISAQYQQLQQSMAKASTEPTPSVNISYGDEDKKPKKKSSTKKKSTKKTKKKK